MSASAGPGFERLYQLAARRGSHTGLIIALVAALALVAVLAAK